MLKIQKIVTSAVISLCALTFGMFSDVKVLSNAINLEDIVIDVDVSLEQQYEFTLKSDGTYEISNYIRKLEENPVFKPSPDIYLPKSYRGKPVTSIGNRAFNTNNFDYVTGTVNIPSSITSIGDYAFSMGLFTGCNIPESVTSIGISAFQDTPWLESMRKQNPVVIVNNILIDARTASGDVVLPDTLTAVPAYSFYENELVKSVYIPDSVKVIGEYAFKGCKSLEKFNFPKGITEISKWSFSYCESLSGTLTIPSNVKTIGNSAFWSCKGLTAINIQNGVTYIGGNAFKFCMKVTDISIPESVEVIEGCAFSENRQLKNIVIPKNVKLIGQGCFRYDYSLDSVTIMNPNCEIYDDNDTFPGYTDIHGHGISTAYDYAKKYERTFTVLDQNIKLGDIDGDGLVDGNDASAVLSAYSKISTGNPHGLSEFQLKAANVNSDELVDADDASLILSYYSYTSTGKEITFENFISSKKS